MKKITVIFLILLCFIGNAKTIYPQGKVLWLASLFSEPPASPSYKVYTALLTQTGTNAPTATVLENTLGVTITTSYIAEGTYKLNSSGIVFITDKTAVLGLNGYVDIGNIAARRSNDTSIYVYSGLNGTLANDIINKATIEIRVYP
jgi:hypothetical protein